MSLTDRKPARSAHHRTDNRKDPIHNWRRRCAYRLSLLCSCVRILREILAVDWPGAPVAVQAMRLRARVAVDKAWPLVVDADGGAWE